MEENKDKIIELMSQITELVMRVNLETDLACWMDIAGHVSSLTIRVSEGKEALKKNLTRHNTYYFSDYQKDKGFKEFEEVTQEIISDLNNLLSSKWEKKYTAYCNLIDMSCSQVFTSESAAKRWVSKMKRKYDKVFAIVGYSEETFKV